MSGPGGVPRAGPTPESPAPWEGLSRRAPGAGAASVLPGKAAPAGLGRSGSISPGSPGQRGARSSPRGGHGRARLSWWHRSRGPFAPLAALPRLPGCRRGPLRVPFVTLSRALLCQHGVGKWLCLTRTCRVCDLAGLVVACASPKQQQGSPLPGAELPSPPAPWGDGGAGHAGAGLAQAQRAEDGRLLLPSQHWPSPVSSQRLAAHPVMCLPYPTQHSAARIVGVLTHDEFSCCPCDFLGFICASAGEFRACSTPPRRVSAAPAASSCPSHQSSLLSTHCDADFFVLLPGEGKRKKAERRRGKIRIKNS